MPGAYAHITLVNEVKEPSILELVEGFDPRAISSILKHFKFCELGAVSPDYPYLDVMNTGSAQWADLMHYENTGDMIKAGIQYLKKMDGEEQRKGFAWLLGYAAHVATDVTIHPVVELKVGSYADNKKTHRVCEMNQDAYIFQRLNLGEVGLSEHLNSGIWACCEPNSNQLNSTITTLWNSMLSATYPAGFRDNIPDIHKWHSFFRRMVDKIAEEGNHLTPIARHVAVNCGLTYPAIKHLDPQYIYGLQVPNGRMDYDQIFEKAKKNVTRIWSEIAKAVFHNDESYMTSFGNWNLDTGKDGNGRYVFWE